MIEHYLANHDSVERLLPSILQRIEQGRVRDRYKPLLTFVRTWKSFNWILDKPCGSLREALTPYLDAITADRLYEMWIFYKTLTNFEPMKQKNDDTFVNTDTGITIEYHKQEIIDWQLEKNGVTSDISRYPDIVIRKGGRDLMIIDAKCMRYSEPSDEEERQEPAPDRNIVNQMIVYLDYNPQCNSGVVLFADPRIREAVRIKKGQRSVEFMNCYPYSESTDIAFDYIKSTVVTKQG
jgi:hypothetical protein